MGKRRVNAFDIMAGKNAHPPPLPIEVFERVQRVARFDGKLLVIIAATFAAFAAVAQHLPPMVAGLLAAGCGLLELNGTNRLQNGDPQGLEQMIMAQVGLIFTVLSYASWMLVSFDAEVSIAQLPDTFLENLEMQMAAAGVSATELPRVLESFNVLVYTLVAVLTLVFQGLMVRFYRKSRPAVHAVIFGRKTP